MLFNKSIELFVIVLLFCLLDWIDIGQFKLFFVDCHKLVLEKLIFEAKFLSRALNWCSFVDPEQVILDVVARIFGQQKFLTQIGLVLFVLIAHDGPLEVKWAKKK